MPQFHLFTMLWGSYYVDMFKRACFRSINWPKNQAAVKDCIWNIYTKREHFPEIEAIFRDHPFRVQLWEVGDEMVVAGLSAPITTKACDNGVILLNGLRNEIHYCLQNKSKMLFCPPDTIFGDGTIPSLISLGAVSNSCVAVSHPRVLPGIIEDIDYLTATRGPVSNAQLVTLSFKHAHDSWKFSEIGHEKNGSLVGGIAWKMLSQGLWSVTHHLPTHYFVDFNETDYWFFWSQVGFGAWDHRWPAENIIRQQRQRYVGSSDACFICEITDWDKNVPEQVDRSKLPVSLPEDFYRTIHYHHTINRQTNVIYRGE